MTTELLLRGYGPGTMDAEPPGGPLSRGWNALASADWGTARSAFQESCDVAESAEALDGLGRALHFEGEYGRAIETTERAFAAYRRQGQLVAAADRARLLAFLQGVVNSNMAVASGWMARAETLLE